MKVSFISAVNDNNMYEKYCLPSLPEGHQYIAVEGAKSICKAYNIGIDNSKYKVKCFLHQDVRVLDDQFISKLSNIFSNKEIGLIGVIGSIGSANKFTMQWDTGRVLLYKYYSIFGSGIKNLYTKATIVDGLCLITNTDLRFDEETFTGWHFYDMDYSMQVLKSGREVVVADILMNHLPNEGRLHDPTWATDRIKFLEKWSDFLGKNNIH